jgi:hypothetical protein
MKTEALRPVPAKLVTLVTPQFNLLRYRGILAPRWAGGRSLYPCARAWEKPLRLPNAVVRRA